MRGSDMARALVLGGAGFIGYHLTRLLAGQGAERVVIVDNLSRGQLDEELTGLLDTSSNVVLHTCDLTDARSYDGLDGPFDHVYLLAGVVGVRNVQDAPARVLRTNTAILLNSMDWLAKAGCGRLLFASTSEAYAGSVELGVAPVPTDETAPLCIRDIQHPRSTYALTKMLGEAFVTHCARQQGFESVIVRFHNVYGPRMGMSHVVPELMQRIYKMMNPLPVYGLEQTRAFCYVTDAVRACASLMTCRLAGPEIVNVGNDREQVSIEELAQKLMKVTGFHPAIQRLPAPEGGVTRRCPDIRKLRALTGYTPLVDLEQGLALTWKWYSQRFTAPTLTLPREAGEGNKNLPRFAGEGNKNPLASQGREMRIPPRFAGEGNENPSSLRGGGNKNHLPREAGEG
jgi:nucleoside-diphosphate-sugar epimerase